MNHVVRVALLAWLVGLSLGTAQGGETIDLTADDGEGRTRITGDIVDYTGQDLVVRMAGGRERRFPGASVAAIEFARTTDHSSGDEAYEAHNWPIAIDRYRAALSTEQRRWVRRLILARLTACYRAAGQWDQAVDSFLILVRNDPQTPYYAVIPLAWFPMTPSAELAAKAEQWLTAEQPEARLIGASLLLSTAQQAAACKALAAFADDGQSPTVAALAEAQTWRALAGAELAKLDLAQAEQLVNTLPEPLRGGPLMALARVQAERGQTQDAVFGLLRVALLYDDDRPLAARALLAAGERLVELQQPAEAERLFREVVTMYAGTPEAAQASTHLSQLKESP